MNPLRPLACGADRKTMLLPFTRNPYEAKLVNALRRSNLRRRSNSKMRSKIKARSNVVRRSQILLLLSNHLFIKAESIVSPAHSFSFRRRLSFVSSNMSPRTPLLRTPLLRTSQSRAKVSWMSFHTAFTTLVSSPNGVCKTLKQYIV